MIPKRAIELAIEGGWQPERYGYKNQNVKLISFLPYMEESWEFACSGTNTRHGSFYVHYTRIALDPTFWQALGKSCGWEAKQHPHWRLFLVPEYSEATFDVLKHPSQERLHPWEAHLLRFIRVISTGDDTEEFWEEILK